MTERTIESKRKSEREIKGGDGLSVRRSGRAKRCREIADIRSVAAAGARQLQ